MLHGDISNQRSFTIGFRCEDTLFHSARNLKERIFGSINEKCLNEEVLSIMKYIYYNTEMTSVLVIDERNFNKKVEKFLLDFPASQIKTVMSSLSEISMMLNTGELTYFVTDRKEDIVNSSYAISSTEFQKFLRKEVKRF